MSLLGQINLVHNVGRLRSIGSAPQFVKGHTYDYLYQRFERPHHALGNRYRNPLAQAYDIVRSYCIGACRRVFSPLGRIEISIRMKPQ